MWKKKLVDKSAVYLILLYLPRIIILVTLDING